ncbi:hypothetical protein [Dyadobacter sp. CY323]|uniref:hypothetical protein n=1 Tax=Dyadobacter sp. CY323 TaxID=2907302 RepID=UPI001F1AC530|nr:hypothetical protein [Dyadobacter sp. CY323]MCE6989021.1 hypothetical protein [Dyadobacter sp. CY323]
MASITNLRGASPKKHTDYLLDANVWIFLLGGTEKSYQQSYIDFVGKIPRMNADGRSKIILPSCILSEVVNRMMKDVFMNEFARKFPTAIDPRFASKPNLLYKHSYRAHRQYDEDFGMLLADMNAYGQHIVTVSDNFAGTSLNDIMDNPPTQLDFTDYTISKLAKDNQLVIVTDDGDFKGGDNDILTVNRGLLGTT